MIDLPIASTEAKVAQSSAARKSTHSTQHAAAGQADESGFQSALAQELEAAPADATAQAQAAPAHMGKTGVLAASVDDAVLGAAKEASADVPENPPANAMFPMLPGAGIALPETGAALHGARIAPQADGAARLKAPFDLRQAHLLKGGAKTDAGMQLRMATDPADFAASGKLASPDEVGLQREFAFAANLFDQHHAGATPATLHSPVTVALAGHSGAAAAPTSAPVPVATIGARVGAHAWDQGLGDKLVWMAGQKHQVAELHLNPPDLGPLKITLTLNDDQASAQFFSAHATVREAIESAMPKLREMLADSGITLGNTDVSADTFREQAQPQQQRAYSTSGADAAANSSAPAHTELPLRRSLALVDIFA